MKYYICCSGCGRNLVRSENGTKSEMFCPKCGAKIEYEVTESTAVIKLVKPSTKKTKLTSKTKVLQS